VIHSIRCEKLCFIGVITAMCLGLYLSSLHSYLLFHGLIEVTTIAIGFTIFIVTWNTRRFLANNYLSILGIGYAFIALIDLLHALAYKGMNVFPGFGANLPTQLWIAARFLQAVTLCIAPLCMGRGMRHHATFGIYAAATSLLVAMIYLGYFPDCYIEGKGLTTFKIDGEYLIIALLLISLYLLYRKRKQFDDTVFLLLFAATVCSALSGIMFTTYVNVYDIANLAGHFLKLASFYLVYRALLVKGFQEPFALIFRDLKQTEAALLQARDTLEEKVRARTAALHESELSLRQAHEFTEQIINSIPDPILVKDRQHRFVLINNAFCSFTGHAREELIGKSDYDFFPTEEADEYCSKDELVFNSNQPNHNEETLTDTAGNRHYIQTGKAAFATADGTEFLIGVIRDITGRKRTEKAMCRLNRELRAISNCNRVLMRAEYEQTLLNEICHIVCDEAGYHMAWVGYARTDDTKAVCPVAWAGFDNGYIANLKLTWSGDEERGQGPAGKAFRSGEPINVQDIATDPRMAPWRESALQHGYRSSIALPLKDKSAHTFGILNIYSSEPNAFTTDETRLLEELSDNLAFGIMVLRDRAERKRAEENLCRLNEELDELVCERTADLERANARLKELDRMKSMFIASMSHELRTPLNSTIGFSRILLDEWAGPLNDEQRENLDTILKSGKHLLALVNDVIDVSRIEAGKIEAIPRDFDIHDCVSETVRSFDTIAESKGVEIKVHAVHHPMRTDRIRLLQCLLNLVGNAVKFTEKGTITICAKVTDDGDRLEISVTDTGIGIREEDLGKLFSPFVRLESPLASTAPGTGLGLYLTRKLVKEVLQGAITVQSTHGVGSRFVLTAPVNL